MTLMRPKWKAFLNLLLAMALLGTLFFFWNRLELLYNRPDGKSAVLVWKRGRMGPLWTDLSTEEGRLRHNMGKIASSRVLMKLPTGDIRTYVIFLSILGGWGLVQLYLAFYYFRLKAR